MVIIAFLTGMLVGVAGLVVIASVVGGNRKEVPKKEEE